MADTHNFKRLVLGLHPSAPHRTVTSGIDIAEQLRLDVLGLFLEDSDLRNLASIPFAREFRPFGGGWHPIDVDRLTHDMDLAARNMQRQFTEAARRLSTNCRFEVIRGFSGDAVRALSRTDDIIMVPEPPTAADRATQQFLRFIECAFGSIASVMLVPTRVVRTSGPVVAVAATLNDPSIRAAADIAAAVKEKLVILCADKRGVLEPGNLQRTAVQSEAAENVIHGPFDPHDPIAFGGAVQHLRERLLVVSRGTVPAGTLWTLAASRGIPVLVIESSEAVTANAS